jgi:fatty acid desaturase
MNLAMWLFAASLDWTLIVCAVVAVSIDCRWLPVAWLVIGNRQHALGILMHEAAHGNISRAKWLNDWTARLFTAWPLGIQLDNYRQFHLHHHARLNLVDDPEIVFKCAHPSYFAPRAKWRIACDLLGDLAFQSLNEVRTFYRLMGSDCEFLAVAFFWLQAVILTTMFGGWWIVPLWVASFVSIGWAHNRLRIWLEHSGTPHVATWQIRLPRPLEWLLRPHRVGLHWEHHRCPKLAWWRLRAVKMP